MHNVINQFVEAILIGGCVEIQERRLVDVRLLDLTDMVITSFGLGPEDWDALDDQLFLSDIKAKA